METPHNASPVRVIEEVDGIDRLEPLGAYQSQLVDLVRACSAADPVWFSLRSDIGTSVTCDRA